MNKIDFIEKLLKHKELSHSQRGRIIGLALNEFKKDGVSLDEIIKRIETIEGFIEKSKNTKNNPGVKQSKNKAQQSIAKNLAIPIKNHSPKEMVKFLFQFSTNDSFKWFTHKPDLRVDDINYLNLLDNFKRFKLPYSLNYATIMFIRSFFQKKPDSNSDKLHIYFPEFMTELNYSNERVLSEIKNGINPFDIRIGEIYFVDIINKFKCAIEFRLDKEKYKFSVLFKQFITDKVSIDFKKEYTNDFKKNAKSLSTYVDVNNFFRGINLILVEWINGYKSLSNELIIDLKDEEENDYYLLTILHKGSKIEYEPYSPKLNGLGGNLEPLRKYWFSVVDFEIQADFSKNDTSYKIIFLDSKTKMTVKNPKLTENVILPLQDSVGGVKYLIKIYKNK